MKTAVLFESSDLCSSQQTTPLVLQPPLGSEVSDNERDNEARPAKLEIRTCPTCGTKFSATGDIEACPVCMLRRAAGRQSTTTEDLGSLSNSEIGSDKAEPVSFIRQFENYQLMFDRHGKPVELGRGAMGITYKALDVDLRVPVTVKVIRGKYLGDESARRRFLREARAAASVRHPNVAAVYHLGRNGQEYFYAMEFVEGETLERAIRRSGRLDVKLALEIMTQVAAGLAAIQKKNLVHRDIKPSNIMVCMEEGEPVKVKIIDLGLVKRAAESESESAISVPGTFAGTPQFASPEQFVGSGVDIRSDLYSLGVTLWNMLAGQPPFQGTVAELMNQHLKAALPVVQLKDVPSSVVALLQALLEKDPVRRLQTPVELLKLMPAIKEAIEEKRGRVHERRCKPSPPDLPLPKGKTLAGPGPKKISIARLPVTGSDVFGREEDVAFLDDAWADPQVNIVTVVAWAGVGKSTLVNHWLQRMRSDYFRSAQLVFGWSFYRQGTTGEASSADEFVDAALAWFGDPDPRIGTAWEKGERLAKLITRRRTLLVLDGLEPVQNPPGPQEGRLREPALQAFLRELAAFNRGLCVITTRLPIADIAAYERSSALRRDLEYLSSDAGAKLLRALGVQGEEEKLRIASDEFSGHCLALTLLGSYLTDAYKGDIRCRTEVSERLAHDSRQGVHARKVMESYQIWLGDGPELSILQILGLFDRPAGEPALRALLRPPAIRGLTESLVGLSPTEWQAVLTRLRRARLLAVEDPHNPGQLDTHPLVREYFREQLRNQRTDAWKEGNSRLYHHYRAIAREFPETLSEMEPLFLAVVCGCNASQFRGALHEVYLARIQRRDACFAAKVLGARGALLSALVHFFESAHWGSPLQTGVGGQRLTAEDHLFILSQAALYLTDTRGFAAPEARICYERMEAFCYSLNRPWVLLSALNGLWRYSLVTDRLGATLQIANRICALAQERGDSALMIAYRALALTRYYLGDFEAARKYATHGLRIWRSGTVESQMEELGVQAIGCLCYEALSEWHRDEIASCHAAIAQASALAKELNDMHGLAVARWHAAAIAYFEHDPAEAERLAAELVELSTRYNFAYWLAAGVIVRGWARAASGDPAQGISLIEDGMKDYSATRSVLGLPFFLVLKAEALHFSNHTSRALRVIKEAEAMVERFEERWWSAELHRLRGIFLVAISADDLEIENSFRAAIKTAKEQKSISLTKRAEASYANYLAVCRKRGSFRSGSQLKSVLMSPKLRRANKQSTRSIS